MPTRSVPPAIFQIPARGPQMPAKEVVGSKAHNLMRMAGCGLPVPPGFVISTDLCRQYFADRKTAMNALDGALDAALEGLSDPAKRRFGDPRRPLLLSVRSGAAISMPGMMETVLNIGLTRGALGGLVRMTGNPRHAQDCRRRLIQQFGEVVHHIPAARFEARIAEVLAAATAASRLHELATKDLKQLVAAFEEVFENEVGTPFPDDPRAQLRAAIEAVLASWSSERAQSYRRMNGIPDSIGTAVTVQAMAFGNIGPDSGAGVGFTRSPADGSDDLYVDFVDNAQGEDVVAGRHVAGGLDELERRAPQAHAALLAAKPLLEREFHDMQDFEFTVEEGRLLMLQARSGKRTPIAALRIACEMVAERTTTREEALHSLAGIDLDAIVETHLRLAPDVAPLVSGTSASIGVAVGAVCFDPGRMDIVRRSHRDVVLVRRTAETEDIAALADAAALITVGGARTSHAAVVARQLGKPCVVACTALSIEPSERSASVGGTRIEEGDIVSVDAGQGRVYAGGLEISSEKPARLIEEIRKWRLPDAKPKPPSKRRT